MEQVHDDALVPEAVVLPGLLRHQDVRSSVAVLELHIGLVRHPVEILVQAVQQECQELLANKKSVLVMSTNQKSASHLTVLLLE